MYHLMIVDDEDKIRSGISSYFPWNEIGFEVVKLVANGQEAFDFMLSGVQVDVILCDIMMPIVNGLELLEMMQESGISNVKVVILSGYREFEFAHKAIRFGVSDYLLKPTKYKELQDTFSKIRKELDEKRSEMYLGNLAGREPDVINRLKSLIRENYQDISLQKAADEVHLNAYYISKLFKSKTGQNFYEFLLQIRMETAANLLLNSDLKIYEISERVGYKNQKSFLKIFKRFYDKNPTDFRKERHD